MIDAATLKAEPVLHERSFESVESTRSSYGDSSIVLGYPNATRNLAPDEITSILVQEGRFPAFDSRMETVMRTWWYVLVALMLAGSLENVHADPGEWVVLELGRVRASRTNHGQPWDSVSETLPGCDKAADRLGQFHPRVGACLATIWLGASLDQPGRKERRQRARSLCQGCSWVDRLSYCSLVEHLRDFIRLPSCHPNRCCPGDWDQTRSL